MEEEEEARTAVYVETATTVDEVEAEDTITLTRAALLKENCTTLLVPVFFYYGQKSAADLTRSLWEKLVQYVGTNYRQYRSN